MIFMSLVKMMVGIGTNSTISMSNTIKIIASRKNRMEKGIRAVLLGSNPHSNGEDFSRSAYDRALSSQAARRTIAGIIRARSVDSIIRFIN